MLFFPPPPVNHLSTPALYSILPKLMSPWLESRPSSPSILILLYRLKRPWTTNFIQASTPSFFFSPSLPWSIDQQHHHLFIFSCRVAAVAASFFSIFMLLGSSLLLSLLCVCLPCVSQEHRFIIICSCLLYGLLLLRSQLPSSASFTFFSSYCGRGVWLLLLLLPMLCFCSPLLCVFFTAWTSWSASVDQRTRAVTAPSSSFLNLSHATSSASPPSLCCS